MPYRKTIAVNRKARFNYDILETFEAGLVLKGTEIKAIREGRANLGDAYAKPNDDELWLLNTHIATYSSGTHNNHEPTRPRKLLLHKTQILHLRKQINTRGLTVIPLKLYLKNHVAKIELGLARGRRKHDKRRAMIDKYREQEAKEAIKPR